MGDVVRKLSGLVGNLSVRTSLTTLVALTGIVAVVIGVLSLSRMSTVAESGRNIYSEALIPSRDIATIRENVRLYRYQGLTMVTSTDSALAADAKAAMQAAKNVIDTKISDYSSRDIGSDQRAALESFATAWSDFQNLGDQATALKAAGKTAEWAAFRKEKVSPKLTEALGYMDDLSAATDARADAALRDAENDYRGARVVVLVVLVIGLVLAVLVALVMAGGVIRPLRQFSAVLNAVADGDLTRDSGITSRNDLAQETTKATENISQRVSAIQTDTGTAVDAISKIAGIIGRINEFQTTIASAVEQQSAVTGGMAADLSAAAVGAEMIGTGIKQVTGVADDNRRAAHATASAAADLTQLSDDLQGMVRSFRY